MNIQTFHSYLYEIPFKNGGKRTGVLINIVDEKECSGWGDIAPLPKWSTETLHECLIQLGEKQNEIIGVKWTAHNCLNELKKIDLLPSLAFGLESALLSLLSPLSNYSVPVSALLMGSKDEILKQAILRYREGYTSAKLKVSHLSFADAASVIHQLKDKFFLRIDVNRAWSTSDAMRFFAQFPLDAFDYVEEPFQNPQDLACFLHPLAVDESFPNDLTLKNLEYLPNLKALIYKPTMQGGLTGCVDLHEWAKKRGVSLVLSSSFESDLGLAHIASMAHRLSLSAPIGIGTYEHLNGDICATPLKFIGGRLHVSSGLLPILNSGYFV